MKDITDHIQRWINVNVIIRINDKYKKTKSSGKIEIVNDCKMFPYPSTATIKRMSVTELADLTLSFTFSKMRQDFNIW